LLQLKTLLKRQVEHQQQQGYRYCRRARSSLGESAGWGVFADKHVPSNTLFMLYPGDV
jgi:hypothetical protein